MLPPEIIDQIISLTDLETAIVMKNDYSIKKFYNESIHTVNDAAMNGHLETLKWLHKIGKTCTNEAMNGDARNGHLEIVEFLQSI